MEREKEREREKDRERERERWGNRIYCRKYGTSLHSTLFYLLIMIPLGFYTDRTIISMIWRPGTSKN